MNIKTTDWKEKEIWKGKMKKEIARHNYKIIILFRNYATLLNINSTLEHRRTYLILESQIFKKSPQ